MCARQRVKSVGPRCRSSRFPGFARLLIAVGLAISGCSDPPRPPGPATHAKPAKAASSQAISKQEPPARDGAERATGATPTSPQRAGNGRAGSQPERSSPKSNLRLKRSGARYEVTGPTGIVEVVSRRRIGGKGRFDRTAVDNAIDKLRRALVFCYRSDLAVHSGHSGFLKVEFSIRPEGRVTNVSVEGLFATGHTGRCVAGAVGRFRFDPAPTGGSVTFRYAFKLEPGPDKAYMVIVD